MEFDTLKDAIALLCNLDNRIMDIVFLTILVTMASTSISMIIALPIGTLIGSSNFWGRGLIIRIINTFMGFPPVLAGLIVYLVLSKKGSLGFMGLLYTPYAMLIAQVIIIIPILCGLIIAFTEQKSAEIHETCVGLGLKKIKTFILLINETRMELVASMLTGYGRAISEVGAVMIVGGNIEGSTRVMTTSIVLETGKGNYENALALGIVLIFISFLVNLFVRSIGRQNPI